jgi:hypothetical protein
MNATVHSEQAEAGAAEFEGDIREFVRKDVAPWRRRPESAEAPAENINFLVERVAGSSLAEIDNVINELHTLREMLRSEGDRVQRAIAAYADLSQTAMASMKIISDSMAQLRATSGSE